MKFYLPDWDDNVDADYDFIHDENSELRKPARQLDFIWDIYGYEDTPIDGVLISREQIEGSKSKRERLRKHGVYKNPDPKAGIARWLPTISDCGAWGYKALPEPPYETDEMLEFYEDIDVTVGVTIDHLVLSENGAPRLYLDKRALPDDFSRSGLPDDIADITMIDEWRTEEPSSEIDPRICDSAEEFLEYVDSTPHAVYYESDAERRYRLTIENAKAMRQAYENGDYSFRLMAAIQGWGPKSYAKAAREVLDAGYNYIGIGGMANSSATTVKDVVGAVGNVVTEYERKHETRVDVHIFGFAKNDVFNQIGRSGITSFDSASMLRSSWTGGKNYHLSPDERYHALRVHPSTKRDAVDEGAAKELRAQELLHALRAYDQQEPVTEAIETWRKAAREALDALPSYLREHRHDERFDGSRLTDVGQAFRDHFEHGRTLKASFGEKFRSELAKKLRADSVDDPLPFTEYEQLIDNVESEYEDWYPGLLPVVENALQTHSAENYLEQVWVMLERYTEWSDEEAYLEEYRRTLVEQPWEECSCPICTELGIDVAIFRANNRNRRRGFHNIYRFYQEFTAALPRILIGTPATPEFDTYRQTEAYLRERKSGFWQAVNDLPVCEIGVLTANGVSGWWTQTEEQATIELDRETDRLERECRRYDVVVTDEQLDEHYRDAIESAGCDVVAFNQPTDVRSYVLEALDYTDDYLPRWSFQPGITEFE